MEKSIKEKKTSTYNPNTKKGIIAEFLSLETTLIPLNGKVPTIKNWTDLQFSKETTPEYFTNNYGVKLEEEDLVIDYDPRNDTTEGKRAFQNLVNYVGEAFDTMTVKTGSNGLHVYMKKPSDIEVVNEIHKIKRDKEGRVISEEYPEFAGLEFKSAGRQVVGPGSIHPETKREYILNYKRPSDERMQAPNKLLELIKKPVTIPGVTLEGEGMGAFTDDTQTIARYVDFLNKATPAVEGCGGDQHTYSIACRGRDFNLSPQKTYELMWQYFNPKCVPIWEDKDLWVKVKSAYVNNRDIQGKWSPQLDFDMPDVPENLKKAPLFVYDKQGNPKKMLCNVMSFFKQEGNPIEGKLRYNLFTRNIEFKTKAPWHYDDGQSWNDEDAIHLKAWLSDAKQFEINTYVIHEAALNLAKENAYHPIQNYLEGLKWDGKKRLGNWLSEYCACNENIYTRAIGEKVLVAAVSRIFKPGTKFDHILVVEGTQGIGKSTLVSILGKYWFGDIIIDPHNKDTIDALRGKWVVEISEMECTKREVNALKRFITCTSDRVRPAYAKTTQDFPRQCIFIGTINPENGRGYLKDPTGNRRYWPVKVEAVDYVRLREDVDQLWAEALQVYKSGRCKLYLDNKELQDFASREVDERFESDPLEEVIGNYLVEHDVEAIRTTDIMQNILLMPVSKLDKFFAMRLSCAMNRLGYENTTKRFEGKAQRCYIKRQKNGCGTKENNMKQNETGIQHLLQKSSGIGKESTNIPLPKMDI